MLIFSRTDVKFECCTNRCANLFCDRPKTLIKIVLNYELTVFRFSYATV